MKLFLNSPFCFQYRTFFTPIVFARLLQNDIHGRISTMAVFNYIMRKVWLQQTRIGLSLYDATGQGLLSEMVTNNRIIKEFMQFMYVS